MAKNRKKRKRKFKKIINIFCEGAKNKSENAYLKALICDYNIDGNNIKVEVVDIKKNTGKELVKAAKALAKEEKKYKDIDEYWVVYDKDGYTKHPETFDEAYKNGIKIAFSSICFEMWILLHFEYTTKAFNNSDEIIHYLVKEKKYINYSKGDISVFHKTKANLERAIKNAKKLNKYIEEGSPNSKIYELNPYTDIYKLIENIINNSM